MSGNLTAIKITQLSDIGANISATSLIPIVDTSNLSNPITDKANLQIVGNLILNGAGGTYFPPVAQAFLAQTVTNAAQPNITSVGVLNNLSVTDVSVLNIPGGSNGYYLRTNGNGNVSWAAAGSGGNTSPGGLNTQIQYNNAGTFAGSAGLTFNSTSNTLTTSNIFASNISATILSGNLTSNAQPNITSLGTLTSLSVTGNIRGGNLIASGSVVSNIVTGNYLYGDGSNISNVNSHLTVADSTNTYTNINSIKFNGATVNVTGTGNVTVTITSDRVLLQDVTVSSTQSAVPLTAFNNSIYLNYIIVITGGLSDAEFQIQMSTNGGATYDTGGNYDWSETVFGSGGYNNTVHGNNAVSIQLPAGGSTSPSAFGATINLYDPNSSINYKQVDYTGSLSLIHI